ncbi:hypothetical protein GALL_321190 [mine drainage metagenome]|jgi:hypothetical protein|uniref:Uncharacterized protein n=1 Tax=mine drainage metagenome TaxID=410659 RepID=A0A1J5RD14_9ZZZZ
MSNQNPDQPHGNARLKKLIAADTVLESLLGREKGSVALQYVKSHTSDIQKLLVHGLSATRISELLAAPLDARPSTVLAALHETGLVQKRAAKESRNGVRNDEKKGLPGTPAATSPSAASPAAKPAVRDTATNSANIPARTPHQPSTALELPPWANGSDKRDDETDEDYCLRKNLEGPPEAKRKFIGEHNT